MDCYKYCRLVVITLLIFKNIQVPASGEVQFPEQIIKGQSIFVNANQQQVLQKSIKNLSNQNQMKIQSANQYNQKINHKLQKTKFLLKPKVNKLEENSLVQVSSLQNQKQSIKQNLEQYQRQDIQENKQKDEKSDDIATSSTDDMFAFSQIVASGGNVAKVTAELEEAQKQSQANPKDDEDMEILAFSNSLPGNDGAPVFVEQDKVKIESEKQAQLELEQLQNNDATQAFASLVTSQDIQQKVQQMGSSADMDAKQQVNLAQTGSSQKQKQKSFGQNQATQTNLQSLQLLQLLQKNLQGVLQQQSQIQKQQIIDQPIDMKGQQDISRLNFSPEQLQYLSQLNQLQVSTQQPTIKQNIISQNLINNQKQNLFQGTQIQDLQNKMMQVDQQSVQDTSIQQKEQIPLEIDQEQSADNKTKASNQKVDIQQQVQKPIDQLEKVQQPADNDDDEKLADNHRKMAKINLKKEEIRKLEDTHQALTKDALKQAKSGASMKKVAHNLKIAKNVAKRVEDLKQQVQSDQKQLQTINNVAELDQILPFKKDEKKILHQNVEHIPSVQDSSTGQRHSSKLLGNLLETNAQGMSIQSSQAFQSQIDFAKQQIKNAQLSMKQLDDEENAFHAHMTQSIQKLMQTFSEGYSTLESVKEEQKNFDGVQKQVAEQDEKQQNKLNIFKKNVEQTNLSEKEAVQQVQIQAIVNQQQLQEKKQILPKQENTQTQLAQINNFKQKQQIMQSNIQQQNQNQNQKLIEESEMLNLGQILAENQKREVQINLTQQGTPQIKDQEMIQTNSDLKVGTIEVEQMMNDQQITTDELQNQAALLVQQANEAGLMGSSEVNALNDKQQILVQQPNQAAAVNSKQQINSLLSKIKELTAQKQ